VHEKNTCQVFNQDVVEQTWKNYEKYILAMVEKWTRENGLGLLDLGAAFEHPSGYLGIDLHDSDLIADLNFSIPVKTSSIGLVRANDFLEHVGDSIRLMNEIYRVLAPGGWLFALVPSTDGRGAFQDPTHKAFFNENSFLYYTDPKFARFILGLEAKFQKSRVLTFYPSEWHRELQIPYVDVQLIAVKPGYHPIGECLWVKDVNSED